MAKKKSNDFLTLLKKSWDFIWNDDSFLSLALNILLAFIIIKFLVYPALGFVFQSDYPIVAVVSGSMEHKAVHPCIARNSQNICIKTDKSTYEICGNSLSSKIKTNLETYWNQCGSWYETNKNITKSEFEEFEFKNGFNTGDIMIIHGYDTKKVGDILVFWSDQNYPIIHRIVGISTENGQTYYHTKGDHNSGSIYFETKIPENKVIGKAFLKIPYFGWIKIGAVKVLYTIQSLIF